MHKDIWKVISFDSVKVIPCNMHMGNWKVNSFDGESLNLTRSGFDWFIIIRSSVTSHMNEMIYHNLKDNKWVSYWIYIILIIQQNIW